MAGLFVFLFVSLVFSGNTDNSKCRVSSRGMEYKGTISKSLSGADCLFWNSVKDLKGEDFIDLRFPDGSKRAARNYCRNPSMESTGPWCYIFKNELQKELCSIPFCFFSDCRWTGLGEEYNGTISKTISMEDCENWTSTKYSKKLGDVCVNDSASCGSCRNFDSSFSGPWCMVGDQEKQEKHYCDVPFCQLAPVIVNTAVLSDIGPITTYHKISNDSELKLKVRLWDPNEWLNGQIGVLVSIFDIPATPKEIVKWHSGVFITMGNVGSMIAADKVFDRIETPTILSSMQWTNLSISWKRSSENFMVSLHVNENRKPLLVADLKTNNTYLEKKSFQYFSVLGVKSFWDFSLNPDSCLVTTTSFGNKSLWFLAERVFGQAVQRIYLKTYEVAVVSWRESFSDGDLLRIHIARSGRVVVEEISEETVVTISDVTISHLDFSSWNQINISVIGDSLLVTRILESKFEVAANLTFTRRHLLWFGLSSQTVSYWSVNCNPEGEATIKSIKTEDCSTSSSEIDYKGFSNIGFSGKFCTPWSDERIPGEYQNITLFNRFGGILHSENYCRNLDFDRTGAFCFVAVEKNNLEKQKCLIPPCAMEECKLAGTGTDYSGKLAETRSGRICRNHTVCRNPDKSIGGPWCNTADPLVDRDFCLIQDCEWHSSEIMLAFSQTLGNFYILPHWKKSGLSFWIKNWDPENDAVLCITMSPFAGTPVYKLIIGGGSNENIILKFVNKKSESVLFQESASHIIKSGRWTGFWLRCSLGHVELGHEKKVRPFFEWESAVSEEDLKLQPMFLNFGTLNDFWVGIRFVPSECIVERLVGASSQLWPITLWKKEDDVKTIDFYLHGDGNFSIHFIQVPDAGVKLSLLYRFPEISFVLMDGSIIQERNSSKLNHSLLSREAWKKITVRFSENYANVAITGEIVLEFTTQIFLFYWFKVECVSGTLAWSANCEPLELGGEARDGGWGTWSPWSCSAACGGGEGFRERFCNSPRPNLMGTECVGIAVYRGPCNTFPCGDAPPELMQQIRKRLASASLSLVVKKGESVRFDCNTDLASVLMENVPNMGIEWVLNGFVYTSPRAIPGNFSLEINETNPSDTGVWVCLANWQVGDEDKSAVLSVTSLIVTSLYPTNIVRETLSFNLNCNGVVLGQIYSQLSQKWILDSLVWDEYFSTILEAVEVKTIHNANMSHSGVWICVISQDELNLTWKTAWINLQVDPAPNFWSHLIQDMPIFSGLSEQAAKVFFLSGFFILLALPMAVLFALNFCLNKPGRVNNSILNNK